MYLIIIFKGTKNVIFGIAVSMYFEVLCIYFTKEIQTSMRQKETSLFNLIYCPYLHIDSSST